jgi:lysophospholipase
MSPTETTQLASAFNLVRLYPQGWQSGSFRNDENRNIYYAKASAQTAKIGTVIFTTGYGDSVNFHYDAIRNFQSRGYDVYAMDWIGQGLSDRENPDNLKDSNDRLMARHVLDLHKFATEIVPKDGKPLHLATHSMGGHVGMLYLKHFPETFDRAIMAAPLLDLNTSFLPRSTFKGIVHAANALGLGDNPLPNWRSLLNRASAASDNMNELTNHPDQLTLSQETSERVRQLLKPVEVDLPSWLWIKRVYSSLDNMRDPSFFKDIKTPTLLISAGRDELVSNKAIEAAAHAMPYGQVLDLPTAVHGVWNSNLKNHDTLWKKIDSFIETNPSQVAPQNLSSLRPGWSHPPSAPASTPSPAHAYG